MEIIFTALLMGLLATTAIEHFIVQKQKNAAKKATFILLLLVGASTAGAQNTGFLVCFEGQKTRCKKVQKITTVEEIAALYFPRTTIDFTAEFAGDNNLVRLETQTKRLYIERKLIIKKRSGRIAWRRITNRNKKLIKTK